MLGSSKINVPKSLSSATEGDSVMLGIRPEHLTVNEDSDGSWESKVFVVEKLGSGTFLYLEKEGEPLVVQTEETPTLKLGILSKLAFLHLVAIYLIVLDKLLNNLNVLLIDKGD